MGVGLIAAGSLGIGLLVNGLRHDPLPLVYASPQVRLDRIVARLSPASASPGQWRTIELDELQGRVSAHQGVAIDARPASFYRAGHIPGAINLPRENFEKIYPEVRALLEPVKNREFVVYCSESDCRDSELVADALSHLGYQHLRVYKEGWEEWSRAGLPQTPGLKP